MRLLVLYQHAPTPGAPGIYRHRTLLAELVRRGWDVDLVSCPINYMHGTVPEDYRGKPYRRETIDGITHHWVWASGRVHRSMRWRALNYVTFATTSLLRAGTLKRPDIILASSPPLSVATVGRQLARRFRCPWVFEVRDLWPETAAAGGLLDEQSRLYQTVLHFSRAYSSKADAVLVPTPGLIDLVKGHGARDVELVTGAIADNAPDPATRARVRERLQIDDDECVFAYVGAHGILNGLSNLLDAAEQVAGSDDIGRRVRFLLAGDGSDRRRLEARLTERPIAGVHMLGPVPKGEVLDLLSAADVGLHMLRPDELFRSALPTKVLEYFGAHRPFITTVPGLPQELAEASGGAYAADVAGLTREIRRFAGMTPGERHDLGEQAFRYGWERYGLNATVDRLERLLVDTVRAAGGAAPAEPSTGPRDASDAAESGGSAVEPGGAAADASSTRR